jgi:hypothetical protein
MSNMTPAQRLDAQADWPASCPKGFSRHVATVEVDGCQVYYCAPTHNIYDVINPPIKRPPFIDAPDVDQPSNASFIPDPSAQPWNDVSPSVDIGNTDLANITLLLSKLGIFATNITTLLSDLVNKTAASSSSNDKASASLQGPAPEASGSQMTPTTAGSVAFVITALGMLFIFMLVLYVKQRRAADPTQLLPFHH